MYMHIHMYVCVYMYTYMYSDTCVYTHIHMYIYIYVFPDAHTYTYMYITVSCRKLMDFETDSVQRLVVFGSFDWKVLRHPSSTSQLRAFFLAHTKPLSRAPNVMI